VQLGSEEHKGGDYLGQQKAEGGAAEV